MIVFLIIIFVISAILLTVVVLVQDDQGEGIGGLFSGGSGTAFGSRSGNVLTRFTSILAAVFLASAFAVAWLNRSPRDEDIEAKAKARQLEEVESSDWYIRAGELREEGTASGAEAAEEGEVGTMESEPSTGAAAGNEEPGGTAAEAGTEAESSSQ